MASNHVPLYDGLFLMSPSAGGDLTGALTFIRDMLERAEARILTLQKWDDRKLAYPVRGQKRGTFILALFHVRGGQIANIERDCTLSEEVTRVLITRADHLGETEIEAMVGSESRTATQVRQGGEETGGEEAVGQETSQGESDKAQAVAAAPADESAAEARTAPREEGEAQPAQQQTLS